MQSQSIRSPTFRSDLSSQARGLTSQRCLRRVPQVRNQRRRVFRAQAPPAENQQEQVEYKDSWSDVHFINMCRKAYGNLAGWQSPREWQNGLETYQGMIEVSRALMKVCDRCCLTHPTPAQPLKPIQPTVVHAGLNKSAAALLQ